MKQQKKEQIKDKIDEFLGATLDNLERAGKLDHFEIEIINHEGTLQMNQQIKHREKAY